MRCGDIFIQYEDGFRIVPATIQITVKFSDKVSVYIYRGFAKVLRTAVLVGKQDVFTGEFYFQAIVSGISRMLPVVRKSRLGGPGEAL